MTMAVGGGKGLETGGKVGSFANDSTFLSLPGADQIADHHKPGGNSYADLERFWGLGF